jgi:hypothetical protein
MKLERVLYCSEATVPTESLLVIAEILAVSQRNNERDSLTGALAVNDGWFLQAIEGPPSAIDSLLRRLAADPRHRNIEILDRRPIDQRRFAAWSMISARVTPAVAPDLRQAIDGCRERPLDALSALAQLMLLADR